MGGNSQSKYGWEDWSRGMNQLYHAVVQPCSTHITSQILYNKYINDTVTKQLWPWVHLIWTGQQSITGSWRFRIILADNKKINKKLKRNIQFRPKAKMAETCHFGAENENEFRTVFNIISNI